MVWHCIHNQHIAFRVDLDSDFFWDHRGLRPLLADHTSALIGGSGRLRYGWSDGRDRDQDEVEIQASPGSGIEVEAEGDNERSVQRVES